MKQLARRARHVYLNEGVTEAAQRTIWYVIRYFRHLIGSKGLYGSSKYRNLLLWWNSWPYSTISNPFKIVYVDPSEIEYITGRGPNPGRFQWQDIGTVEGGEWDRNNERVDELPVVRALRDRFENHTDWEHIQFIQYVLDQADKGNIIWRGCTDEVDVWNACEEIDQLYESVNNEGYQRMETFVNSGSLRADKFTSDDDFNRYDEVVVDVGRDGQFLFVDGRHRLAIAKILRLKTIPVRISARHAIWQEIRQQVAQANSLNDIPPTIQLILDHPDLQDVWNN